MHGSSLPDLSPLTAGGNVTAGGDMTAGGNVTALPSGDHNSLSPPDVQGLSVASVSTTLVRVSHSQSEPITSENPAPPLACTSLIPASTSQVQDLAQTDEHTKVPPQTKPTLRPAIIDAVWSKTLKIADKKLRDNNLPFSLTNLASQLKEESIEAVINGLDTLQKDEKKKRWRYTWRGREVIVVERLGKILKIVEKYSKVIDTAIQSDPGVTSLVWAGVWAVMRVRTLNGVDSLKLKPC